MKIEKKDLWYPVVVSILLIAIVVPVVLYYGFGIKMPIPQIR